MSNYVNRVYLPDSNTLYVSDNQAGDDRLVDLYKQHGNLRVETCHKVLGASLDDATVVTSGTITSVLFGTE